MPRDVCLALGGGGARGLAHIGVLAELERAGYRIAALAGTSIGGVMASLYAVGLSPADMAGWAEGNLSRGLFHFPPSASSPPQGAGGSRLVDGGVVDPVPVQPVRALHRAPVVAVALSARPGSPPTTAASPLTYLPGSGMFSRLRIGQALQVFGRSLEISPPLFTDLRLQLDNPEVTVRPDVTSGLSSWR